MITTTNCFTMCDLSSINRKKPIFINSSIILPIDSVMSIKKRKMNYCKFLINLKQNCKKVMTIYDMHYLYECKIFTSTAESEYEYL